MSPCARRLCPLLPPSHLVDKIVAGVQDKERKVRLFHCTSVAGTGAETLINSLACDTYWSADGEYMHISEVAKAFEILLYLSLLTSEDRRLARKCKIDAGTQLHALATKMGLKGEEMEKETDKCPKSGKGKTKEGQSESGAHERLRKD